MSKLSPTGQSMAALFTNESEKLRNSLREKSTSGTAPSSIRIPGAMALKEGSKTQDSLGNPSSPGYEFLHGHKKDQKQDESPQKPGAPHTAVTDGFQTPSLGPQFIRLGLGWDTLLTVQKKICEKAKGIFTRLEGPPKYKGQRRSSFLEKKSRGSILDVDVQTVSATEEEQKKKAS